MLGQVIYVGLVWDETLRKTAYLSDYRTLACLEVPELVRLWEQIQDEGETIMELGKCMMT